MISHRACRQASVAGFALLAGAAFAVPGATAGTPSLNPMASYPQADLKAFVSAPLFDPARRLPPPPAPLARPPAPPEPIKQPPVLQLVGVIGGTHAQAIVQHAGQTQVLQTGDTLDGWFVEVLPVTLRLHSGLRAYDYAMFQANDRGGPFAVDSATAVAAEQPPLPMTGRSVHPGE